MPNPNPKPNNIQIKIKIVKLNEQRDPTSPYNTIKTFPTITEALKYWDTQGLERQGLSILADDGNVSILLRLMPKHFQLAKEYTSPTDRLGTVHPFRGLPHSSRHPYVQQPTLQQP